MDQVSHSYQNGHTVFKEVDEDGTVREYHQEQYLVRSGTDEDGGKVASSVVLKDTDAEKVYQQHEILPDGREMITTTTIIRKENGEVEKEVVEEIVESEEVEIEEEVEDGQEGAVQEVEVVQIQDEETTEITRVVEVEATQLMGEVQEETTQLVGVVEEETVDESIESDEEATPSSRVEEETTTYQQTSAKDTEQDVASDDDTAQQEVEEVDKPEPSEETADVFHEQTSTTVSEEVEIVSPAKTIGRRISYEEFAEQYTEYKPPKRYEKKQTSSTSDKAAPKIRIMGLPNTDMYSPPAMTSPGSVTSPKSSSHSDDIPEDLSFSPQPTKTQGSIIRRMDQDSNIDPANIVRAEDKPDPEAELPSRGTSQSLKTKFQSMESSQSHQIDFSQPVKKEPLQNRHSTGVVAPSAGESDHKIPEFEGGEIENTPEVRHDVVREADRDIGAELPEEGQAKNLLSKWSKIETDSSTHKEYKPSGVGSKPTVTPLRPSTYVNQSDTPEHVIPELEGGEYENTPEQRTDVIKESDTLDTEQELPTKGLAKSLMSQFKQKEAEAKNVQVYKPSGAGSRAPKVNTRSNSVTSSEPHVEPQFEGGAVENTPVTRADVVRESDRTDEQEIPEKGYAKNLKARFKELQDKQKSADYVEHRPSGVGSKATPTPNRLSATGSVGTPVNSQLLDDEMDGRIEPQVDSGEYESQPIKRTDVLREEDGTDEQELPEKGIAKNLMDRFKTLESEKPASYKPSGVGSKATPSKLHIMAGKSSYSPKGIALEPVVNTNDEEVPKVEAGEYENTPMIRDDVVRADTRVKGAELPEQGVTKNIMSRFKSMEVENKSAVEHRPSKVASKPTPTPLRPTSATVDANDSISETSSTDHLETHEEPESIPEVNHNVVRSSDSNETEYTPTAGAAKSLMDN